MGSKVAGTPNGDRGISGLLTELMIIRDLGLRPLRLDMDHFQIMEAVATGRAHCEAESGANPG
jgi:hypothetical protein